jgi:alkanesulfonate monooxygenase SsuD/methylene tetrahydromethanopterin reductase-like flavin-dependent oxidoreductase (luciferase family)
MPRIRVNWLPRTLETTRAVAAATERCGLDGLGVCDSPTGIDVYVAIAAAVDVTEHIAIGSNVTNPTTRTPAVHAAAVRGLAELGPGRIFAGFGTGDSAVRGERGKPATLAQLEAALARVRADAPAGVPLNVAAGGPRGAALAGRVADGLVAGAGRDAGLLRRLHDTALASSVTGDVELWASLRVAVGDDSSHVAALRRAMAPRAASAARFNLAGVTADEIEARGVPRRHADRLAGAFAEYDFEWHGRAASENPNRLLLDDDPELEEYLVDRYAVIGTVTDVAARLAELDGAGVTGVFASVLFEDPIPEIERLGRALAEAR